MQGSSWDACAYISQDDLERVLDKCVPVAGSAVRAVCEVILGEALQQGIRPEFVERAKRIEIYLDSTIGELARGGAHEGN